MRGDVPKPLLLLAGEPLIVHVLRAAMQLRPRKVAVVVAPWSQDQIRKVASECCPRAEFVLQKEPLGTADAAKRGMSVLADNGVVMIMCADAPLLSGNSLRRLSSAAHRRLALLTFPAHDPAGYGRIARAEELQPPMKSNRANTARNAGAKNATQNQTGGVITAIVEDKHARGKLQNINEVFSGALAAPSLWLKQNLKRIRPANHHKSAAKNKTGEYYLTGLAQFAFAQGKPAASVSTSEAEAAGINTPAELASAESEMRRRRTCELLANGVRIVDPARVDVRGKVRVARGAAVDVNVVLDNTTVAAGAVIGANCVLIDCKIGTDVKVEPFCHLQGATIGARATIGPFARIRPQTDIRNDAKVGNFVEVKNARLGANAKAGHLAYLGDAEVGANVNIGAGVITCNYDGKNKHKTVIGADAFIGSDTQLIAPVKVGRGAYVAAGTTLTKDAPARKLTWSRAPQSSRRRK